MPRKSLVLVDGSYYLFRAFHAIRDLRNSAGEPTNAIFGVLNMLRKLLAERKPDYFAIVFDTPGKNFRNDLYPEYKAHRPPTPEDLVPQIAPLQEIIRALGLPLLAIQGVEADDVIATLARQAEAHGLDTVISSGDKDLCQIVNEHIRVINTMDGTVLDPEGVRRKFGVDPGHIIDYLALVGDSVDNVPGVPKVGPKTAASWLAEYGSLDQIVAHAGEFKGKVGDSLRASLATLPLSRLLVTLRHDLSLPVGPQELVLGPADTPALRDMFHRFEFRTWLAELDNQIPGSVAREQKPGAPAAADPGPTGNGGYETVFGEEQFMRWLARLEQSELFAIDTETTSLDYINARIVGVSFAVEPGSAAYVPLAHDYPGAPDQLDRQSALERLKPLLEDAGRSKLGHNLKYDMSVFANHGIALCGIRHDSMLESYVLDSTASRHDMDTLAERHLGITTIHYEDVAGKGAKQLSFNQVPVEQASQYAAEDADVTLRLHRAFWPRLAAEPGLKSLYEKVEVPLIPVLSRMERNGVRIDAALLRQQSQELSRRMIDLEQQAVAAAGQPFNIGSPKQIQAMLYEKMNLPVLARTPTGQPSTAESVLTELAGSFELPRLILEHRGLAKLKSTYTDRLPEQVNPATGRVHTSFHQAVAATGRLSSSDPNLQNIPIRTMEGRRIRQAFIASEGHLLLAADYSQIELRIMAHLSGDRALLEAFARGEDIHRQTASEVFDLPPEKVTDDQRRAAKAINFGLIYGMSPFGLAKQLGIERAAAKQYVDRYFERYPAVKEFMDRVRAEAKDRGYVETVFRRRLHLPDIRSRNAATRQYAERTAINAPMQGTAADIIKRAMIAIDRALPERHPRARMILQVHDELVFEAPADGVETLRADVVRLMAGAAELRVPLGVDTGVGKNWDEAH
ncbi:MAG: DNA polymerase I [Gammaproteobacteria bacterium]|nr:DNA polymerase I [Gammaproteobacteria bacterium]